MLRAFSRRGALAGIVAVVAVMAFFSVPAFAAAPSATTGAASAVTYQSATLAGSVRPGGLSTVVYFQYGTTSKYGVQSAPVQVAAGSKSVPISIPISGLTATTTYHYRIVATNATGTALGADMTVKTAKIPLALAITAAPDPVVVGAPLTLEGTLSGTGSAGAVVHLQANPYPYTAGFADVGNPELTLATGSFAFNVLGIAVNTKFRVVSGKTVSSVVTVSASVGVTLTTRQVGTKRHPAVRFSGAISPAEPSARIAIERLNGTSWKVVGGTVASPTTNKSGAVSFTKTIPMHHGGFFRALVLPVEGAHVSGYSGPVLVSVR
ncbi:MAG: hypothetical protein ACRDLP_04635 [Solirubrobacteraceae bacterium]